MMFNVCEDGDINKIYYSKKRLGILSKAGYILLNKLNF